MKKEMILALLVIGLFFVNGQTGCETLNTNLNPQGGGGTGGIGTTQWEKEVTSATSGAGLNIKVPSIIETNENRNFYVDILLTNTGKEAEPVVKVWDLSTDLTGSPSGEQSISLNSAKIGNEIQPQEEFMSFGPYAYTGLKADATTTLFVETNAYYDVNINLLKGICVSERKSTYCEDSISETGTHSETISGNNLGEEAGIIPITVTSVKKTFRASEDGMVDLTLEIYIADKGQGAGLNKEINNFEVTLGRTRLTCDRENVVDIRKLKGPITCDASIDLGTNEVSQKSQSQQLSISFNYDYIIRQSIPVKIIHKEEQTI